MDVKAKSLHEAIALLNQGRNLPMSDVKNTPPPPAVAGIVGQAQEANTGISLLVTLKYQSLSGNLKERDILIRRVIRNKTELYLDGVAMDIRAPRLIQVSRIREIRDITTGRIYTNPFEFVETRLGVHPVGQSAAATPAQKKNDFAQVIERTGHEMTVLMYLVAIDGKRDKSERDTVFKYIRSRTPDLTYPDSDLEEYLISLAPDTESFTAALGQVLKEEKSVVQLFVEAILDVIMVDGRVDDRERSFLVRLMSILEQDGYEITLPL